MAYSIELHNNSVLFDNYGNEGGGLRMTTAVDAQGCGKFLEQGVRISALRVHRACPYRWRAQAMPVGLEVGDDQRGFVPNERR